MEEENLTGMKGIKGMEKSQRYFGGKMLFLNKINLLESFVKYEI
jgi:hypothetical protein